MSLCPKCGKESRGLCLECFFEEHPLEVDDVKLCSCGVCNRLKYRDKWGAPMDDVASHVAKSLKTPFEVTLRRIEVKPEIEENSLLLEVEVDGSYKDEFFKKTLSKKIKLQKSTCQNCSRKSSGYFEAVLQFRCEMPGIALDDSQIAKVEPLKEGFDYYLLSNNYARGIASQLRKKGYKIKTSNQTFSRRDGREVYRVYYSIKKMDNKNAA